MRHFPLLLGALVMLAPIGHAKELAELRERVRDGVKRTDKDLAAFIHRDKLNEQQRTRFDAAVKDLHELSEAVAGGKWEGERARLERAVENIDFLEKHAPLEEGDRQVLGIDVYTLQVILDNWTP
jgi:hypothetical protein